MTPKSQTKNFKLKQVKAYQEILQSGLKNKENQPYQSKNHIVSFTKKSFRLRSRNKSLTPKIIHSQIHTSKDMRILQHLENQQEPIIKWLDL